MNMSLTTSIFLLCLVKGLLTQVTKSLTVKENSLNNTLVGNFPTRAGYTYKFDQSTAYFYIQNDAIYTKRIIDREKLSSDVFELVILSSEPVYPIQITIKVLDENDNAPIFQKHTEEKYISEDTDPGIDLLIPTAIDSDSVEFGTISYAITRGNEKKDFRLIHSTSNGHIQSLYLRIMNELDRENTDFYNMTIKASDVDGKYSLLTVLIFVRDVNDEYPLFDISNHSATVAENADIGTPVLQVHASDNDLGENGRISYSMVSEYFSVNAETGEIVVNASLMGSPSIQKVIVVARDNGNPHLQRQAFIEITLLTLNRAPPKFTVVYYSDYKFLDYIAVSEDIDLGKTLATVYVFDEDGLEAVALLQSLKLPFELTETSTNGLYYFKIKSSLKLSTVEFYSITLWAMDKRSDHLQSRFYFTVRVVCSLHLSPSFKFPQAYYTEMKESSPVGSFVISVEAVTNKGYRRPLIIYSIIDQSDHFNINEESGLITLAKKFDYEKFQQYVIQVSAHNHINKDLKDFVNITVEVTNVVDCSPKFTNIPNVLNIKEDEPLNSMFYTLLAESCEHSMTVFYSLLSIDNHFTINKSNGSLYIRSSLNGFGGKTLSFNVIASYENYPNVASMISIDVNIIKVPFLQFCNCNSFATVGASDYITTAELIDENKKYLNNIQFSFTNANYSYLFNLNKTGSIFKSQQFIKNFKDTLTVGVSAVLLLDGNKYQSHTDIHIYSESNYFQNGFEERTYAFSAYENSKVTLGFVRIIPSLRKNFQFKNYIFSPFCKKTLSIDEEAGLVSIEIIEDFDAERSSSIEAMVFAISTELFTSVRILVTILDSNDNSPVFQNFDLVFYAPLSFEKPFGKLNAYDADSNANGELYYGLNNCTKFLNISLHSGHLSLYDFPNSLINFCSISAYDNGVPQRSSTIIIEVIFTEKQSKNFEYTLLQSLPVNYMIDILFNEVCDNAMIEQNTYSNFFQLLPNGGLYLIKSLYYMDGSHFLLTVYNGCPQNIKFTAEINVVFINDHTPNFELPFYSFAINEEEPIGTIIGKVSANDADDLNSSNIVYSISELENFSIDSNTGVISTNVKFDYEQMSVRTVNMSITAFNDDFPELSSQAMASVEIKNIDDDPPMFTPSRNFIQIIVNNENQILVRSLAVNGNGKFNYEVALNPIYGHYSITKGALYAQFSENNCRTGVEVAIISANVKEVDLSFDSTNLTLYIEVICNFFQPPVFSTEDIEVLNSVRPGTVLTKIIPNVNYDRFNVTFEIQGNTDMFYIQIYSGTLTNLKSFDFSQEAFYKINIITKVDNKLKSSIIVNVNVISSEDITPKFTKNVYEEFIQRDFPLDTTFFKAPMLNQGNFIFSLFSPVKNNFFQINEKSGEMTLISSLSACNFSKFSVVVAAQSSYLSSHFKSFAMIHYTINTIVDKSPIIVSPPTIVVQKDAKINVEIANVYAFEPVSKEFVSIKVLSFDQYFGYDVTKRMLFLIKTIDFSETLVSLRIQAEINSFLSSFEIVVIIVTELESKIEFSKPSYEFETAESTSVSTAIGRIEVNRKSTDFSVQFYITDFRCLKGLNNSSQQFFTLPISIDRTRGDVMISEKLDFDLGCQTIRFTVSAIALSQTAEVLDSKFSTATVLISNSNDNAPSFQPILIELELPENTTVNTIVYTAEASDLDRGSQLTYFSNSNLEYFKVLQTGDVVLIEKLSFHTLNSSEIEIVIICSDNLFKSELLLVVTVLDLNEEEPQFVNTPYQFFVKENAFIGHLIGLIVANDIDSGSEVTYSLSGDISRFVQIDYLTGDLYVSATIDADKICPLILVGNVTAYDRKDFGTSTFVYLNVIDVNDNPLEFNANHYSIVVSENDLPEFPLLTLSVIDRDCSDDVVGYFIDDRAFEDVFFVDMIGQVYLLSSLNREEYVNGNFTFQIGANDGKYTAYTKVYVTVLDVNDHSPEFLGPERVYLTDEKSYFQIVCRDQDFDGNSVLRYSLKKSLEFIELNSITGEVVVHTELMTYPSQVINFMITDNGDPELYVEASIEILKSYRSYEFLKQYSQYSINLAESNIVGTEVFRIPTSDEPACSLITCLYCFYLKNNEYFDIEPRTGEIFLKKRLDFETSTFHILQIQVCLPNFGECKIIELSVNVEDVNDNSPIFEDSLTEFVLNSDSIAEPIKLIVSDVDNYPFNITKFELVSNYSNLFSIDSTSGELHLLDSLQANKEYVLEINAYDIDNSQMTDTIILRFLYPLINNIQFLLEENITFYVPTNAPLMSVITTFSVNSTLLSQIRYEVSNNPAFIPVNVHPYNGTVFVAGKLPLGEFDLQISAIAPRVNKSLSFSLVVLTSNSCRFEHSTFQFYVYENDTYQSLPFTLLDCNRSAMITNLTHLYDFSLNNNTLYPISLDYETQKIYAFEFGIVNNEARCLVIVYLLDRNDNIPQCEANSVTIMDSLPSDSYVTKLETYDSESSDSLEFSLLTPGPFSIEFVTGVIRTSFPLDFKNSSSYSLVVKVNDGMYQVNCSVFIEVKDANNFSPKFSFGDEIVVYIADKSVKYGTELLKFYIEDGDSEEINRGFSVGIASYDTRFALNETSLINIAQLGSSSECFQLKLSVSDNGFPSLSSLSVIRVCLMQSDELPFIFVGLPYSVSIPSTIDVGADVFQVQVISRFGQAKNELHYRMEPSQLFCIEEFTGRVRVNSSLISYKDDSFILKIELFGDYVIVPSQKITTYLTIKVKDINSEAPFFSNSLYNVSVPENIEINSIVINDFHIQSNGNWYSIDLTKSMKEFTIVDSKLLTNKILDYEIQNFYELEVVVNNDFFHASRNFSKVIVVVEDVNEYPPVFMVANHSIFIVTDSENKIFAHLKAIDNDSGIYGLMNFKLLNATENFSITQSGIISATEEFDYTRKKTYYISVRVSNIDSVYSDIVIVIEYHNSADVIVRFSKDVFEFNASEDTLLMQDIGNVAISSSIEIVYMIIGQNEAFSISSSTGEIVLVEKNYFKRKQSVVIHVLAYSGVKLKDTNYDTAKVLIRVIDVNDPPFFINSKYSANVFENASVDSVIAIVKADDFDFNSKFSSITYYLTSGNTNSDFVIGPKSGSVKIANTLNREDTDYYSITVIAVNNEVAPQLSAITSLEITVLDVNDNAPRVVNSVFNIKENLPKHALIGEIQFEDSDLHADTALFQMKIMGNSNEYFSIQNNSQLISKESFDREVKSFYLVSIEVSDNGVPPMTAVSEVRVNILDENDSPSKSRPLVVRAIRVRSTDEILGKLVPLDDDINNSFNCQPIVSSVCTLKKDCTLYINKFISFNHKITVQADDGLHSTVQYQANVELIYYPLSINNVVSILFESTPSVYFQLHYLEFLKSVSDKLGVDYVPFIVDVKPFLGRSLIYMGIYHEKFMVSSEIMTLLHEEKIFTLNADVVEIGFLPCSVNPCLNEARCSFSANVINDVTYNDYDAFIHTSNQIFTNLTCVCPSEFSGNFCELSPDICDGVICVNGASCAVINGSRGCKCPKGYSGSTCSIDINECSPDPCRNGGICSDLIGNFKCNCTSKFEGERCEKMVDQCVLKSCNMRGLCTTTLSGIKCSCDFPYLGDRCQHVSFGFDREAFIFVQETIFKSLSVSFSFVSSDSNALLFSSHGLNFFSCLEIMDETIVLIFQNINSADIKTLSLPFKTPPGKWTSVTMKIANNSITISGEFCKVLKDCTNQTSLTLSEVSWSSLTFGSVSSTQYLFDHNDVLNQHRFIGCMGDVSINGASISQYSSVQYNDILDECPKEAGDALCDDILCSPGGFCNQNINSYSCTCHPTLTGRNCNQVNNGTKFSGDFYLRLARTETYKRNKIIERARDRRSLSPSSYVSIRFRTHSTGVLLYLKNQHEIEDFIIKITEQGIEVQLTGNVYAVNMSLTDGKRYDILISLESGMQISINNNVELDVRNVIIPKSILEEDTDICVGGSPSTEPYFFGCLLDIEISEEVIFPVNPLNYKLQKIGSDSSLPTLQPCPDSSSCQQVICPSGKICVDVLDGWVCEEIGLCADQPCLNGGTCIPYHNSYTCQCSLYYFDPNCEKHVGCSMHGCQSAALCRINDNAITCSVGQTEGNTPYISWLAVIAFAMIVVFLAIMIAGAIVCFSRQKPPETGQINEMRLEPISDTTESSFERINDDVEIQMLPNRKVDEIYDGSNTNTSIISSRVPVVPLYEPRISQEYFPDYYPETMLRKNQYPDELYQYSNTQYSSEYNTTDVFSSGTNFDERSNNIDSSLPSLDHNFRHNRTLRKHSIPDHIPQNYTEWTPRYAMNDSSSFYISQQQNFNCQYDQYSAVVEEIAQFNN